MLLRTLGGLALEASTFRRPKPLLLLCYLSLEGPRDRPYLAQLFWPDAADARQSLSVALSQLRAGAPGAIESDRSRVRATVTCDAGALLDASRRDDWPAVDRLYVGTFLEGLDFGWVGPELEEWVFTTREYISARVQEAYVAMAETRIAAGDASAAVHLGERAFALHVRNGGLSDAWHRRLYGVLDRVESPRAADLRREAETLGVQLDPSAASDVPERRPRSQLPAPATPLVGRDVELVDIDAILARGSRLVTLAGMGGIGKTRLALEVARRALESGAFGSAFFVPLDVVERPGQVPRQVAAILGIPLGRSDPPDAALAGAIGDQRFLLVLDNFEHLLDAAGHVLELVSACPRTVVLVTSRQPLDLVHEVVYPVQGLSVPRDLAEARAAPVRAGALELFAQRAGPQRPSAAKRPGEGEPAPDEASVIEICRRVGGSPLGIELAAGLARAVPVGQVLARLDADVQVLEGRERDRPARHASMEIVLAQTWAALPRGQREALERASIFRGGFTREAATAAAGATIPLLADLVERGLVRRGGLRFDLHPLVRAHAAAALAATPGRRRIVRERHAEWFAGFMEKQPKRRDDPLGRRMSDDVRADLENVQVAWTWACERGRGDLLSAMSGALYQYMGGAGRQVELADMLDAALDQPGLQDDVRVRLRAYRGRILPWNDPQGYRIAREVLDELRERGSEVELAEALHELGVRAAYRYDHDEARMRVRESLEVWRRVGDPLRIAASLGNLALLTPEPEAHLGMLERTVQMGREAATGPPPPPHVRNLALAIAETEGDYQRAVELLEDGLSIIRASGTDLVPQAASLMSLGLLHLEMGRLPEAARALDDASELLDDLDHWKSRLFRARLADMRVLLRFAENGLNAAASLAERHLDEGLHPRLCTNSLEVAFRTALECGDTTGASRVLDQLRRLSNEVFGSRGQLAWRAVWRIRAAEATEDAGEARRHMLEALEIATRWRFVPHALDAVASACRFVPDRRAAELCAVSAAHPAGGLMTRLRAGGGLRVSAAASRKALDATGVLRLASGLIGEVLEAS